MDKVTNTTKAHPWLKSYPKNIPWEIIVPNVNAATLLDDAAKRFPNRPCINFLDKHYSYAEILHMVNCAAYGLQQIGVKQGIKVGIFMPNTPYYVIFYYAILKAGGIIVNYNPLYAERELIYQMNDSETEIMITLDLKQLYQKIAVIRHQTMLKKVIVCQLTHALPFFKKILFKIFKSNEIAAIQWDANTLPAGDLFHNDGQYQPFDCQADDDIALLQYTGGTTGVPKGAMLTHKNIYANAHQASLWFNSSHDGYERLLASLPLFHVFAMTAVMNLSLAKGAEIIMMFPRFDTEQAMKMIEKYQITYFPGVPTIYNKINYHPKVKQFKLNSLKACMSGGAPLPMQIKRQFEELTSCYLFEGYGLSETSPAIVVNPLGGIVKDGSIGLPMPGTFIKIVSLDDHITEMGFGEKGEVCVKGPQVMKGYWRQPAETARVMIDGFFHTGDVGYMDEDGFIFLIDRIRDLIISNGYNIYPSHIEEACYLHPLIEEVTVIGIADAEKGEVPKAFIKLKKDSCLSIEDIHIFLNDKLSPLEIPRHIEFRNELPKTIIGKLSKKELIAEEKQKMAQNIPNINK